MLGVTFSRKLSVSQHVDDLLAACAQTLFALRTLRSHGLPSSGLHTIFQTTVVAKLSYAAPAWWGFTTAADRDRLEAFLRRATRFGYRPDSAPPLASICGQADHRLFTCVSRNSSSAQRTPVPPERDVRYSLRPRSHHLQLPARTSALHDNNFMMRILYKDLNYSTQSTSAQL